jgi:hypothetical protein
MGMPDLTAMLLRKSLGSVGTGSACCSRCRRTPLAGERLHEIDSGSVVCDLCLAAVPEEDRREVRSARVHASERHLAVGPRAA